MEEHSFFTELSRSGSEGGEEEEIFFDSTLRYAQVKEFKNIEIIQGDILKIQDTRYKIQVDEYLDEDFYMYKEDVDLAWRLRLAGWKVIYFPEAVVIHDHGRASAKKPWYFAPFTDKLSRAHIALWIKYFWKWN